MSQTKAQLIDNLVQPITGALGSAAAPTFSFTADPNTGLFSPGADAVALATAGTNRLHITSGGLVGIGTTSPGSLLHLSSSSAANVHLTQTNSLTTNLFGINSDGSTVIYNSSAYPIRFFTNAAEVARIDSSGRLLVGTSTANANGGILQLTSGITFPATAVAATDANTLDDYEQGTFTPSIGGSATYYTQYGTYTKIGDTVYCSCRIHINVRGTGSATNFTGLPFTPNQTGGINAGGGVSYYNSSAVTVASIGIQVYTANNDVLIVGTSGAQASITNGVTFFQNSTDFIVSFFYKA